MRARYNPRRRRPIVSHEKNEADVLAHEPGRLCDLERAEYRAVIGRLLAVLLDSAQTRKVDLGALECVASQAAGAFRRWHRPSDDPRQLKPIDIWKLARWADGRMER